jgi:hypothetical protein
MPEHYFLPKIAVERRLYTVPEAAIILNRSLSSVWRDIRAGRLVAVHIGASIRITVESIDRLCSGELPLRQPLPKVQAMTKRRAAKVAERRVAQAAASADAAE